MDAGDEDDSFNDFTDATSTMVPPSQPDLLMQDEDTVTDSVLDSFHDCVDGDSSLIPASPTGSVISDDDTVVDSVFGKIVKNLDTTQNTIQTESDVSIRSDFSIASSCLDEILGANKENIEETHETLSGVFASSQASTVNRTISGLVNQVVIQVDDCSQISIRTLSNNFLPTSTQTTAESDTLSVCSSTTSNRSHRTSLKLLTEASFLFGDIKETEIESTAGK